MHLKYLKTLLGIFSGVKFFIWTFVGSTIWIAFLSYLMVWWATVVGETLGIPSAVSISNNSTYLHDVIFYLAEKFQKPKLSTTIKTVFWLF